MPYRSKAQLRYMHAMHPDIAARWDKEYPVSKNLPDHVPHKKRKVRKQPRRYS